MSLKAVMLFIASVGAGTTLTLSVTGINQSF